MYSSFAAICLACVVLGVNRSCSLSVVSLAHGSKSLVTAIIELPVPDLRA